MDKKAIFWLAVGNLSYGIIVILIKYLLNMGYGSLQLAASMGVFLFLFSFGYVISKASKVKKISGINWGKILVLGLLATFVGRILMFIAQSLTSATNFGFLIKLTALTVIPFAYVMNREKFSKKQIFPVIIMLFGAFLLSTDGSFTNFNFGDLLVIGFAILLGFTNSLAKQVMKEVDAILVSLLRFIFGNILIIALVYSLFGFMAFVPLIEQLFLVLILAVLGTVYVIALYKSIDLIGSARATIYYLTSAVITAVIAMIFLEEVMSLIQVVGGALILIGTYLLYKKDH